MSKNKNFKSDYTDFASVERRVFSDQQCLVIKHAELVVQTSQETRQALRSLRQSLMNCEFCTLYEECKLRDQFNSQVDQVISEINEELGW